MSMLSLSNPAATYRPIPFWSWNDRLDPEELRLQIREMHEQGIGGFFMHARGGLQTAYLSPEWMDCVNACCDEAGKLGMDAWLYDENGWPSGFGGGLVNGLGEAYQQKYLRFELLDASQAVKAERSIAFYRPDDFSLLGTTLATETRGKVLRAFYEVNPFYVDNLDASVVKEFIRVTHQHYYEAIPADLLSHMKGIFTDEPQLSRRGLLWSFVLEEAYHEEYGRELLEELPRLGYDLPDAAGTRVRFWRLCAKLFRDHFAKQIRDWCDAHDWKLTGHYLLEETCLSQLSSNGAIMPQYQYLTVPGMDHLGRSIPSSVAMTQLVSVAAQVGQKQILTESFSLTGWNSNFTGQRYVFQPQLAHGVNLLCQHLQGYTLRGLRKRDYPSSWFHHQPWWGDYHVINGYFSRIGQILSEGGNRVDTLVLHPQSSAWILYKGDDRDLSPNRYSDCLRNLTDELDARQIPHHYADELICETLGSTHSGKIHIGECSYSVVLIPQVTNLSSKLYEMLRVFQLAGGILFRLENPSDESTRFYMDGEPADVDMLSWFMSLPACRNEAEAAEKIASFFPKRLQLTENGKLALGMVSAAREVNDLEGRSGMVYFVVNESQQGRNIRVSLPATGAQVEVIDDKLGQFRLMPAVELKDRHFEFDYYFGGADGALFFVPVSPAAYAWADMTRQLMTAKTGLALPLAMTLADCQPNLLTLDRCRYRVDEKDWLAADIISLQSRLVQLKRTCQVDLEIPFVIGEDFDLASPLNLIVETPEIFSFGLNGIPFEAVDQGFVFDKAFRKLVLPANLKHGENVLSLSLNYHQTEEFYTHLERAKKFESEYNNLTFETELESVYLYGDFGVRHHGEVEPLERDAVRYNGTFEVCPSPVGQIIDACDLPAAGLPFFSGRGRLECRFSLTAEQAASFRGLRFAPHGANTWKVSVNGAPSCDCFWEPYMVPLKGLLKEGENMIAFEWVTSLRNTLGPHHLAQGESYAVVTTSFNTEPNFAGYAAPKTVAGYCFVNLGIEAAELI